MSIWDCPACAGDDDDCACQSEATVECAREGCTNRLLDAYPNRERWEADGIDCRQWCSKEHRAADDG